MTTYYVGPGGDDSHAGTAWSSRFLTLSGAEAKPVAAGDTVYVGPGTYREKLTCGVSGSGGNPITYIGDYLGTNTDGIGGVVRHTASADDSTLTQVQCVTATSKNYRTFQGFLYDGSSGNLFSNVTSCSNWIINQCFFQADAASCINFGGTGTANTIQNCIFYGYGNSSCIAINHTSTVDNAGHLIQNCIFNGGVNGVNFTRVGGNTVKNCQFTGRQAQGIIIGVALSVGQTETVNNCLFHGCGTALQATATGEITEDYNNIVACTTARTFTNTGAHSLADITMFESRWFFNALYTSQAQKLITPFDLASDSPLINVAGTSPTTTDLRGTAVQGAQREWGALEYNPNLKSKVGAYNPPIKNQTLTVRIALDDTANPGSFKANPTIASGDFQVSIDGGSLNNLGTLPTVSPAGSIWVLITLSAAEMNGSVINVQCIDQTSPKEWADYSFSLPTS